MNVCKKIYDLGFNLLPLGADKKPEVCWKQYQTERVDPDVFKGWQERKAFFLITGATPWKDSPGQVVVDCDDQVALDCWLANAPDTPLKTKTSRGYHLFYKHPGYRIRNRVGQWCDGREYKIDIRGDGGYVVAPGSVRSDGFIYRSEGNWSAETLNALPLFYLPPCFDEPVDFEYDEHISQEDALGRLLLKPTNQERKAAAQVLLKGIRPRRRRSGERSSNQMFALANRLVWSFLLPESDAIDLLYAWGSSEGWEHSEVKHKIEDALRQAACNPGRDLVEWEAVETEKRLSQIGHESWAAFEEMFPSVPKEMPRILTALKRDHWHDYLWRRAHASLTEEDRNRRIKSIETMRQAIPTSGLIPDLCRALLPVSSCPTTFFVGAALTLSAHVLNRKVRIRIAGRERPCNLWTLMLGSSGSGKSNAASFIRQLLAHDPAYCNTICPDKFSEEAFFELMGQPMEENDDLLQMAAALRTALDDGEPDSKATLRGVSVLFADEWASLASATNKKYNEGLKSLLTELYEADKPFYSKHFKSGTFSILSPCLSILACSTDTWFGQGVTAEDAQGGFLNRWLYLVDRGGNDYPLPFTDPVDEKCWDQVLAGIERLKEVRGVVDPYDHYPAESRDLFLGWYRDREALLQEPRLGVFVGRARNLVHKIATIYEATSSFQVETISPDSVQRACRLIEQSLDGLRHLCGTQLVDNDVERQMNRVVAMVHNHGGKIRRRELLRHLHNMTAKTLDPILDTLLERGDLRPCEIGGAKAYRVR